MTDLTQAISLSLTLSSVAGEALEVPFLPFFKGDKGDKGDPGISPEAMLLGWAQTQNFQLVSGTRDANGALTAAQIAWPDGTAGVFTADVLSTAFPGAIDAWHATYVGDTTKTVTQPAVTRDANGAVTAQPAILIS